MANDERNPVRVSRRGVLLGALALPAAAALGGAFPAAASAPVDWSRAVIDSTMKRYTPATLGGWGYTRGLYLYGQYLFFKRTGEKKYFDYVKAWVDRFVDADGGISNSFDSLDAMRSCQLLPLLYTETKDARYQKAATKLRNAFPSYPRTSDGGIFHAKSKVGQLWCDGVYMAQPFLALYGKMFGDGGYCFEESAKNVTVYFEHLKAPNGLMFHAYDEDGSESWAKGPGHHSAHQWARAIGWFGMTAIDLLETLPQGHPRRQGLIDVVQHLATGYARYQDKATGLWYQIADRGGDAKNWLETSASAMYAFMLSRGVQRGYLDASYRSVAEAGYRGILKHKVSIGTDGLTTIKDISEGTNVGDLDYYYGRARSTNDFHGLGAFVIMNEQLRVA
ncbi:glycoside hydrolase family 88/105 protein [Amycolatopsis sp. CA-230715]|uniref:glycoside hydrolase family 88/105 protein n=1 Tax=Amycolatopsis sp. CA-230715 TaxID=2745196 RepID=UPI001C01E87B|nr:glycoside hydrolase family 88 protein [Amycolatopsis sp. CA-230715]QWF81805.1 Unsaturated rhamnogalacturonyl hydrolase YteR [Amycolatopsis sp. CA-230715]